MPGRLLRREFGSPNKSSTVNNSLRDRSQHKPSDYRRDSVERINRARTNMGHFKPSNIVKKYGSDKKEYRKEEVSTQPVTPKPLKMDIRMESPPVLFLGNPSNTSAGFLMSGQLRVNVMRDPVTLNGLEVELRSTHTHNKPVSEKCSDCAVINDTLKTWKILVEPQTVHSGEQSFPFSMVLSGDLPATTRSSLASLTYHLIAKATLSTGEILTHAYELDVKRALAPRRDPRVFKRVFPPTKLVAKATFQPTVHPIGDFNVLFSLWGLVTINRDNSINRNRLRRVIWRIEQHEKDIAPACPKHANKLKGETKAKTHEHTRIIGGDEIKDGWKLDYAVETPNNPNDHSSDPLLLGAVEIDFPAHINTTLHPLCDMAAPTTGLSIAHTLTIELIIEDEWVASSSPAGRASLPATPTGAARVLRMTYPLQLTERAGLGLAWDEEQPPVYEDVPPSPPHYHSAQMVEYEGPPLDERFEGVSLAPPRSPSMDGMGEEEEVHGRSGAGPVEL